MSGKTPLIKPRRLPISVSYASLTRLRAALRFAYALLSLIICVIVAGISMPAIAIDLGTTNSSVAFFENNKLTIVPSRAGKQVTPSVVHFEADGTVIVGEEALGRRAAQPRQTVSDIKRFMGRGVEDEKLRKRNWPFEVVRANEGRLAVRANGETFPPEKISALILAELKALAGKYDKNARDAVITVPPHFNSAQRKATVDAAELAGLNVLVMINESTAAALTFCHKFPSDKKRNTLVYDLGGGTFDVSILEVQGYKSRVLATCGDSDLGGIDFDARIYNEVVARLKKDDIAVQGLDVALMENCERAKIALARATDHTVVYRTRQKQEVDVVLSLENVSALCKNLLDMTIRLVHQALADSKLNKGEIDEIIMVGGTTKLRFVRDRLAKEFPSRTIRSERDLNPVTAVVEGAAILAASVATIQKKENKKVTAIGIDLGTTFTCVAYMTNSDLVAIVPNNEGKMLTPSVVNYGLVTTIGDEAVKLQGNDPKNTIFQVKRFMGRDADDRDVKNRTYPFEIVESTKGNLNIRVTPKGVGTNPVVYAPEQISCDIIKFAKGLAEASLGHDVTEAVITVPANFNNGQRSATKDAGELAGFEKVRIVNEPTAAALAYGFNKRANEEKRIVLVYDLGGGTFDVSIMEIQGTTDTVKATGGETYLGGEDFDCRLYEEAISQFKKIGVDVPEANQFALQRSCEKAKKSLSASTTAEIEAIDKNGVRKKITVTRESFEELCEDLFQKTIERIKSMFEDNTHDIKIDMIDDVVLVGGSSRIPRVRVLLQELFGEKKLKFDIPPDYAVAQGAAILAASISGGEVRGGNVKLADVIPLTLGLAVKHGSMLPVIWKNTLYPTSVTKQFVNAADNQTSLPFRIYEGPYSLAEQNHLLGVLKIACPPKPRGENEMETTFTIDENGILNMHVKDRETGKEAEITVKTSNLSPEEKSAMVRFAEVREEEEKNEQEKMKARRALAGAMDDVKSAMKSLSTGPVWNSLEEIVREEEMWISGRDHSSESINNHVKAIRSQLNKLIPRDSTALRS